MAPSSQRRQRVRTAARRPGHPAGEASPAEGHHRSGRGRRRSKSGGSSPVADARRRRPRWAAARPVDAWVWGVGGGGIWWVRSERDILSPVCALAVTSFTRLGPAGLSVRSAAPGSCRTTSAPARATGAATRKTAAPRRSLRRPAPRRRARRPAHRPRCPRERRTPRPSAAAPTAPPSARKNPVAAVATPSRRAVDAVLHGHDQHLRDHAEPEAEHTRPEPSRCATVARRRAASSTSAIAISAEADDREALVAPGPRDAAPGDVVDDRRCRASSARAAGPASVGRRAGRGLQEQRHEHGDREQRGGREEQRRRWRPRPSGCAAAPAARSGPPRAARGAKRRAPRRHGARDEREDRRGAPGVAAAAPACTRAGTALVAPASSAAPATSSGAGAPAVAAAGAAARKPASASRPTGRLT